MWWEGLVYDMDGAVYSAITARFGISERVWMV